MTTQLAPSPVFKAWDNQGVPLSGGKLFTYVAGTTTKQASFTDSTGGTPNTNPVILNYRGEANVWLDPTKVYKLVLAPANDTDPPTNPFWTVDQISGGILSPTGSIIPTVDNLFTLGNASFSWANVYVGPNHATVLDATSGIVGYYPRTGAEITVSVTPASFSYPPGNVLRYGADPTGVADSAAAFLQARQVATQAGIELLIPGGNYKSTATLVWGFASLHVTAVGKVTITFTNSGQCITIDGGAGGGGIYAVTVEGYIKAIGNASTTDAWFVRACHHSNLQMRAGDCTTGLRVNWCVLTKFDFFCSSNEGVFSALVPTIGMVLDQRGVGETTAGCTFTTPTLEGITTSTGIGIDLVGTFNNTFLGGTSESNKIGIRQSNSNNVRNCFIGCDMESNLTQDVLVTAGSNLQFINSSAFSLGTPQPNVDLQGGDNTTFIDCNLRWVHIVTSPTCTATTFVGCQVNNGVSTGIKPDAGAVIKALGNNFVSALGVFTAPYPDDFGNSGTFTPAIVGGSTAGTQTYTTRNGYYTLNGHVLTFSIWLNLSSNTGGTGTALITGLPISARNQTNCFQNVTINDYTGVTLGGAGRDLSMVISPGASLGALLETDTGSVHNAIAITAISGTAQIVISGSYLID